MVLGMLIVAALATPELRAVGWMVVLFSMPSYLLSSLIVNPKPPTSAFTELVARPLIVIATPTIIATLLYLRAVADLNLWYVIAVLVIVVGGTLIGAALNKLVRGLSAEDCKRT